MLPMIWKKKEGWGKFSVSRHWAVVECSLLISECLLFTSLGKKGWILFTRLTSLLCVKRGVNVDYNWSLFRCLWRMCTRFDNSNDWQKGTLSLLITRLPNLCKHRAQSRCFWTIFGNKLKFKTADNNLCCIFELKLCKYVTDTTCINQYCMLN